MSAERPEHRRHTPLRDALREGWVAVAGGSMYPLLPHGSRVRTRPAEEGAVETGTLVVFVLGELHSVHRMIGRRDGALLTKGDASLRAEAAPLRPEDLLGVVVEARRGGLATDLTRLAWRVGGRLIAWSSRGMDLAARALPRRWINAQGPGGRLVRLALTAGNRLAPWVVDLVLRPLWTNQS